MQVLLITTPMDLKLTLLLRYNVTYRIVLLQQWSTLKLIYTLSAMNTLS